MRQHTDYCSMVITMSHMSPSRVSVYINCVLVFFRVVYLCRWYCHAGSNRLRKTSTTKCFAQNTPRPRK